MFEVNKVYKIKVESAPGTVGFGRATVLERNGNQLTIQVRTSKELNANLPKGTRIWFVSDSTETFSGLWASTIVEIQGTGAKATMVCSPPKLEPLYQRRRTPRVQLEVPVQVWMSAEQTMFDVHSKDISRSGIALESNGPLPEDAEPGDKIRMVVQTSVGDIVAGARIIRIEKNWLANKTTVGLEFEDLNDEDVATLDKLLVLLGGKPRNPDAAAENPKQEAGLGSWISGSSEMRGKFVGSNSNGENRSDDQSAADGAGDSDGNLDDKNSFEKDPDSTSSS